MSKKHKSEEAATVELPPVGSPCLYFKDATCDPLFGFIAGQTETAVNVAYFSCEGRAENSQDVPFVADGQEPPESGHFCAFTPPAPLAEKTDAGQE